MFPFPVPDAFCFGYARLEGLILPDTGFVRITASHDGHMNRIGQGGKDCFHPTAEGTFPQHGGQKTVGTDPFRIGSEKSIQ